MIPYARHSLDAADREAVMRVLDSDRLTQGEAVPAFEAALADYCGSKYAVAVSSGTAALHLACVVAGLGRDSTAVVPALTFAATANAVVYTGARPVLSDVDEATGNLYLHPGSYAPREWGMKVVLPVFFGGLPLDMGELRHLARRNHWTVILDAAHALGATLDGKRLGEMGADMVCMSTHPAKHVTTGEGGAVLTNDEATAHRLRSLRDHGRGPIVAHPEPWAREQTSLGWNYRLSDIHAALGTSQLRKAEAWLQRRRGIARYYYAALADFEGDEFKRPVGSEGHAWHLFPIWLHPARWDRRGVYHALHERGVGVQVHYKPVHLQPYYQQTYGYKAGDFPVAEALYAGALSLPLYPSLTDSEVEHIVASVRAVLS